MKDVSIGEEYHLILFRHQELQRELNQLQFQLEQLRSRCPHENKHSYLVDEGGRNSTGISCKDCGEILK